MQDDIILKVENLKQHFKTGHGKYKIYNKAVDGVSFEIKKGEVFSLVGESGCGKTTTGRTIIKIYKPTDGSVHLLGERIVAGTLGYKQEINKIKAEVKQKVAALKASHVADASEQIKALNDEKKEKIKALKVEIKQAKIDQKAKYKPDPVEYANVKAKAQREVAKLRQQIVEANKEFALFKATAFKESDSLPAGTPKEERDEVHAKELAEYRKRRADKQALVNKLSDEAVKTSLSPKFFNRPLLNKMQMIFQDPIDSLDPRMSVKDIIAESLYINGIKNDKVVLDRVYDVLKLVGLQPDHADHYPHEFSGGQRQRIGIARAIISEPQLIIADEPISALDVSIQAQVINLLNELRIKLGLTLLFIAHDLSVVKFLSDRIGIMYFGHIVEMGDKDKVFNNPLHPYTLSLISSIPMPDPNYERLRQDTGRYDPRVHDYSVQGPTMREIEPDHFVLANDEEFEKYQKIIAGNKKK